MRVIACLLLAVIAFPVTGCVTATAPSGPPFERIADGRRVGFHEMLADLGSAQVVFVGELHDHPAHHQLQLEVIRGLHRSGKKVTVALEMFRAENQPMLDLWVDGRIGVMEFMELYRANWTLPWEMYDSIFLYSRNNRLPMLALNLPDGIMKKVYRSGFEALTPEERRQLPDGITCSVDKSYMEFVRRNFVWHSADESAFFRFCEAQLLRNRVMAHYLDDYLTGNPDRIIVVLSGVGHAMRRGIPEELAELNPAVSRILMPVLPELASESLRRSDTDYLTRVW